MELHNLKPTSGSVKVSKRIGRGTGSGRGGTSTKGHKGAKSRSGFKNKRGFEGGQMPLQMRLPKRGFKNINRKNYTGINVSRIDDLSVKYGVVDFDQAKLVELGVVRSGDLLKILGSGVVSAKLNLTFDNITESAKSKVIAAGGSVK